MISFNTNVIDVIHATVEQLQRQRFNTAQEKRTQMDVERFLTNEGICFEREKRLTERDIPDFLIHGGIVLEVKTRCARKMIYRQLERYAEHPDVKGMILLTGTSIGLPPSINGKPAMAASLGVGWL